MSELVVECPNVAGPDQALLEQIARGMPITADVSRSDLLLVCPREANEVIVVAQAQPHSIASLYSASLVGQTLTRSDAPLILEASRRRRHVRAHRDLVPSGAAVAQEVFPILGSDGRLLALLSVETSLIQLERHHQRPPSFQRAVEWLKWMCRRGTLAAAQGLSPFGEWDGIVLADAQRRIHYISGVATNLYRKLAYLEDVRGQRLSFLNVSDDEMAISALESRTPLEFESKEGAYIWIRKALPIWAPPTVRGWVWGKLFRQKRLTEPAGVLILVHDATDERLQAQELDVKTKMIQEVHHRVKNNLQAIAATLRLQARRAKDDYALHVVQEAINRILSVAMIHEFLSHDTSQTINMRDVCQRIASQNQEIVLTPGQEITFTVEGPSIYLSSQHATVFALIVNELIQNAVEHGFEGRSLGQIRITLEDGGHIVRLDVWDDGKQLPADFDLDDAREPGPADRPQLLPNTICAGNSGSKTGQTGVAATVEFPKLVMARELAEQQRRLGITRPAEDSLAPA